jgi:hypothetical protein
MGKPKNKRSKRNSAPERITDEPIIDEDGILHRENVQDIIDELENSNPNESNVVQASVQLIKQSNKAECWEHAEKIDSSKWRCLLCRNIYSGGATRATYDPLTDPGRGATMELSRLCFLQGSLGRPEHRDCRMLACTSLCQAEVPENHCTWKETEVIEFCVPCLKRFHSPTCTSS